MLDLVHYKYALSIAVLAWTFSNILLEPDMIAEKYGDFLEWLVVKGKKWLAFPMGLCAKCFSGQLALWGFLAYNVHDYTVQTAVQHVFFTVTTIFTTWLISKLLDKI